MYWQGAPAFHISLTETIWNSFLLIVTKKSDKKAVMKTLQVFRNLEHIDCSKGVLKRMKKVSFVVKSRILEVLNP